jgi:hypothetical protein
MLGSPTPVHRSRSTTEYGVTAVKYRLLAFGYEYSFVDTELLNEFERGHVKFFKNLEPNATCYTW